MRECALAAWASSCDAAGEGRCGRQKRAVVVENGTSKFEVRQAAESRPGGFFAKLHTESLNASSSQHLEVLLTFGLK